MSGCPIDLSALHGPQGLTDEDRAYGGSRYSEVKAALLENPYQSPWGAEGNEPFPVYESSTANAFAGFLPGGKDDQLLTAARRAVGSRADLRWGEDRCGYRRILHPNGICLLGRWEITGDSRYSGYFRNGSRGLMVARISPHGTATFRGQSRSFGLVGKIYPTLDENHPEPLSTANFYTQQDLGGARTDYMNDAEFRNEPDVTIWRRGSQVPVLARSGLVFKKADQVADARQLHEIAELGQDPGDVTVAPSHMMVKMSPGQKKVEGERIDFRDELYAMLYDPGASAPSRTLSFDVSVADEAEVKGFAAYKRVALVEPRVIGKMIFDDVVASYNGDHVIHFHHPSWRENRNDPATESSAGR